MIYPQALNQLPPIDQRVLELFQLKLKNMQSLKPKDIQILLYGSKKPTDFNIEKETTNLGMTLIVKGPSRSKLVLAYSDHISEIDKKIKAFLIRSRLETEISGNSLLFLLLQKI